MRFKPVILFVFLSLLACGERNKLPDTPAAPEETTSALKIAFITDTHYGQNATANSDMARLIDDINVLNVDFVLMGGDLTNIGSDAQINAAKAILDKLKKPCWVVSGNHDSKWSESGASTFNKVIGYEKFEFEAGGYRFLGCASGPEVRMASGLVSSEHLSWLKSLEKGKPVIFLNHYPLTSGLSNWFLVRRELLRLGCRLVMGGHVHGNNKYDYDGLPGFTGRTALRGSGFPAYNIVEIEDGKVTVSERRLTDSGPETLAPWYSKELQEVADGLSYDSDGLPQNYPWLKYSDNACYPAVKVRWAREEDNIRSGFATDGTSAWYTTATGKVVSLSLADGSVKWSRKYNGKIWATPSLGEGALAFTCTNGSVYVVDAATGEDKWEYPGSSKVACPIIYGNVVYIGSSDGAFRAFNLADGKLKWKCTGIAGFSDATPYADNDQVVVGTWGGGLYSMDTATGKLQWRWAGPGSFMYSPGACPPLKSGNQIFVACPNRITYCLDSKTGAVFNKIEGGRESLALSADKSTVYVKNIEKTAFAFDVASAAKKWEVETGLGNDAGTSALCAVGNLVLIPSDKGYILALDAATGSVQWRHKVGLGLVNPLSAWEESGKVCILASSADGRIELLEVDL